MLGRRRQPKAALGSRYRRLQREPSAMDCRAEPANQTRFRPHSARAPRVAVAMAVAVTMASLLPSGPNVPISLRWSVRGAAMEVLTVSSEVYSGYA